MEKEREGMDGEPRRLAAPVNGSQRKTPTTVKHAAVENERRRRFIDAYMVNGGNATQAAISAGYSEKSAHNQGGRLIRNDEVLAGIRRRQEADPKIDSRAQRQEFWTRVKNDPTVEMPHRLKASELLGKSQADFIEVRIAPIVTDPHASIHSLTERLHEIVQDIKARRAHSDDHQGGGRARPRLIAARR